MKVKLNCEFLKSTTVALLPDTASQPLAAVVVLCNPAQTQPDALHSYLERLCDHAHAQDAYQQPQYIRAHGNYGFHNHRVTPGEWDCIPIVSGQLSA